jgi:carbohydrate binding protein with CBM11 domain
MNDDPKAFDDSKSFADRLIKWLPPIATLISTAVPVIAPLPRIWKFMIISTILWGLCCYLRFVRKGPVLMGVRSRAYTYSEHVRFGAFVGIIGIPSIAIGLFVSQIILAPTPRELSISVATPTPPSGVIDPMDTLHWNLGFCDEKCGGPGRASSIKVVLVPGKRDDAVEILYYLNNGGWVSIKKDIDPKILEGTKGISFFYKGIGAPSTIELKLVLNDETTYGTKWHSATDTGDRWIPIEALYDVNFSCWWLEAQCQQHGSFPLLTEVKRIEISISSQSEDIAGLGQVAFDDIAGIP